MKPHHKIFLTSLALLLVVIDTHCQTIITEGTIEYSVTNVFPNKKQPLDTFNKYTARFRFKDKKQRTDEFLNNLLTSSQFYDGKHPDTLIWIQKEKTTDEKIVTKYKGFDSTKICPKESFRHLKEEKIICGYKCFKAEYTLPGDTAKLYVYYTKEIAAPLSSQLIIYFFNLDGYPMEYNINYRDKQVIYKTTKVNGEHIDDAVFVIPKEYKTEYFEKKNK
jgi:GLPGLI family protein